MSILSADKMILDAKASNMNEAIELTGRLLVEAGHVDEAYIQAMKDREAMQTTFMGFGVAIPHGTNEGKKHVKSTGLSIVRLPEGVDFGDGNEATFLIGIAAVGDEHMDIIQNIALVICEEENVEKLMAVKTKEEIIAMFEGGM
ncbi:PTS sugar transporter subunit IIA [Paenibacillus marinisediminis]